MCGAVEKTKVMAKEMIEGRGWIERGLGRELMMMEMEQIMKR